MASLLSPIMRRLHGPVYARRLQELVRQIVPLLRSADKVLDIGCGFGALGSAILTSPHCPAEVQILGLERVKRGGELIPVEEYAGGKLPYAARSFDAVILADVLHHDTEPDSLLKEAIRISRRLVIIKDHQRKGALAQQRISLIDWAANAPYGVPCLYRYNTPSEWEQCRSRHQLVVEKELSSMQLYPPIYNFLFGGALQYFAALRVPHAEAPGIGIDAYATGATA